MYGNANIMYKTVYESSSSSPGLYIACDFKYLKLAGGTDAADASGGNNMNPDGGLGAAELLEELAP